MSGSSSGHTDNGNRRLEAIIEDVSVGAFLFPIPLSGAKCPFNCHVSVPNSVRRTRDIQFQQPNLDWQVQRCVVLRYITLCIPFLHFYCKGC